MGIPKLAMIVASTANGEIGYKNSIPWKLQGDLTNFKLLTEGQPIIMGRKTLHSLPGGVPLPNRTNIVISSQYTLTRPAGAEDKLYDNTYVVDSVGIAVELAQRFATDWIWFVGGAQVYEEALPLVDRVVLTLVHKHGVYDTKINNFAFPSTEWELEQQGITVMDVGEDGFPIPSHTYLDYRRKMK